MQPTSFIKPPISLTLSPRGLINDSGCRHDAQLPALLCSCSGGGLEVAPYPRLCGENGRYSPPVVMFGRPGAAATAQLLVTGITPRTQWLLHYSFTRAADPALGTKMTGARLQQGQGGQGPVQSLRQHKTFKS